MQQERNLTTDGNEDFGRQRNFTNRWVCFERQSLFSIRPIRVNPCPSVVSSAWFRLRRQLEFVSIREIRVSPLTTPTIQFALFPSPWCPNEGHRIVPRRS